MACVKFFLIRLTDGDKSPLSMSTFGKDGQTARNQETAGDSSVDAGFTRNRNINSTGVYIYYISPSTKLSVYNAVVCSTLTEEIVGLSEE